ncbi:hypothetical protein ES703_88688 [subsurface metagenome]
MSKRRSKRRQSLLDIEFHPEAREQLDKLTEDFREGVSIEAQKQAKRDEANSVQSYHVREAIRKGYEKT